MSTIQRKIIAVLSLCAAVSSPNIASAVAVSGQGTWETTLQGRDLDGDLSTFEAYYDADLNITWLADANYAMTSGYAADGKMTWSTANTWAGALNPYDSGITDWRLPTITSTSGCNFAFSGADCGYNVNTSISEMAHMYYITLADKGQYNTSGVSQSGYGPANTGLFSNVQSNGYWSATEYAWDTNNAWGFSIGNGYQFSITKTYNYYAWAVHDGDVGAAITSAVPVPAAAWLFSSGLLGLVGMAKRKSMA